MLEDNLFPGFLEGYFRAAVANGIDHPAIVNFFELGDLCGSLTTLDIEEEDFGMELEVSDAPIIMPEDLDPVFDSDLVIMYHEKSSLFEINVIPISDKRVGSLKKRYIEARRQHVEEKHNYSRDFQIGNLIGLHLAATELKLSYTELLNILSETESHLTGILSHAITSGDFEQNPTKYIDYSKLSVTTSISHLLSNKSRDLVILTKCKINPAIREFSIRHWNEILRNHFASANHSEGQKIPSRSSRGFIVRLVVYFQTLCEEKALQSESNFELIGIDPSLYGMVYSLDTNCFFKDVRFEMQSLVFDDTIGQYIFLVHVGQF